MAGTLKIGWRNLGRNRRRTVITGAALAVGTCLSVASFGLVDGLNAGLVSSLTRFDLGTVQIHQHTYPDSHALADTIDAPDRVLAEARRESGVAGASPRVYSYALVSHGRESAGAELVGVDPAAEPHVTTLDRQRIAGRYLPRAPTPWPRGRALTAAEKARDQAITQEEEDQALSEIEGLGSLGAGSGATPAAPPEGQAGPGESAPAGAPADAADRRVTRDLARALSPPPVHPPPVFIGQTLARILHARVGDQLHATGQTVDGQSEEVVLHVVGIYATGTPAFDRTRIYMHIADLQRFVHLYGRIHEVAIRTDSPEDAPQVARDLGHRLDEPPRIPNATAGSVSSAPLAHRGSPSANPYVVRDWQQIRPDIKRILDLEDASTAIMILIILVVATLGVVNTMLMAVFERTRELGVLKAIGMSAGRIVGLIVAETTLLALAASAVGTAGGLLLDLYMVHHGVDLSAFTRGISFGGVGVNPVLYGAITARGLILPTAILASTCFVASFYPAVRAARLRPAVGMRET